MSHYADIHSSLLRFASDFREEMEFLGYSMSTVNMDAFVDEDDWPDNDFVGPGQISIDIDKWWEGELMFFLSTVGDKNLMRLAEMMQALSAKLSPTRNFVIYDAQTGAAIGSAVIREGVRIMPPAPTKTRAVQPIAVSFLTDLPGY